MRPTRPDVSAHGHHHHRGADFDWDAMAEALEVDGALILPLVETVSSRLTETALDTATVLPRRRCGLRAGSRHVRPRATVPCRPRSPGIDSARTAPRSTSNQSSRCGAWRVASTASRPISIEELPQLRPADLVWASMVVHHVADPVATLGRLGGLLRPGGMLVVVEFGGNPQVLPDDDPIVAGGAWARLEDGARASLVAAPRPGPDRPRLAPRPPPRRPRGRHRRHRAVLLRRPTRRAPPPLARPPRPAWHRDGGRGSPRR